MMTRKDYVAVANLINWQVKNNNCCDKFIAGVDDLVNGFIEFFEKDNSNFNSDKFWEACFND
jgi:hypothetical protein